MQKKIQSALISVFYKDGLEAIAKTLHQHSVTIYTTGGTQKFIEDAGIPCVAVESLTGYPSILGGRVKTLHPVVFGGILGRRFEAQDLAEMKAYSIPEIDLVIVDLYPFEETLKNTTEEKLIIEKVDIGGPSMIRAAAKNFSDVLVVAAKDDYAELIDILSQQSCSTTIEQRRSFAAKAFKIVMQYDIAISDYFNGVTEKTLRYGENPHQQAIFKGNLNENFNQLNGKELSYNNLVDVDAAIQLIGEFNETTFAIIKHTNVCGIASRSTVKQSWDAALAGDPESAFGGVLITNKTVDAETANAINEIFFEVLIAAAFDADALTILQTKKNRILLQLSANKTKANVQSRSLLNGTLLQGTDEGNFTEWKEAGGRISTDKEKKILNLRISFANT
jgi:phosphoribosylaminoimidazolecarboxamide formyltransferase/IMP cyclohydrolase